MLIMGVWSASDRLWINGLLPHIQGTEPAVLEDVSTNGGPGYSTRSIRCRWRPAI